MKPSFPELYLLFFFVVAGIYSVLAGWTTIFYRKKPFGRLSPGELKVKQGTATLENRIDLFFRTLVSCLFTWQVHAVVLALAGVVFGLYRYFAGQ